LLLGYAYVGFVCYLVMVSLGEMAAYLPHKKGFAGYATRFVDPALGFALGWNYLLKYVSCGTVSADIMSNVLIHLSS
jgi:amino acid transporter